MVIDRYLFIILDLIRINLIEMALTNTERHNRYYAKERSSPEGLEGWRKRDRKYREKNASWIKTRRNYNYWRSKVRVVEHYTGGKNACQCCAEDTFEFLSVDHINGGGKAHRNEIGKSEIYRWIIRNNFPPGFQILCFNCNLAKGFFGKCPHEKARMEFVILP